MLVRQSVCPSQEPSKRFIWGLLCFSTRSASIQFSNSSSFFGRSAIHLLLVANWPPTTHHFSQHIRYDNGRLPPSLRDKDATMISSVEINLIRIHQRAIENTDEHKGKNHPIYCYSNPFYLLRLWCTKIASYYRQTHKRNCTTATGRKVKLCADHSDHTNCSYFYLRSVHFDSREPTRFFCWPQEVLAVSAAINTGYRKSSGCCLRARGYSVFGFKLL